MDLGTLLHLHLILFLMIQSEWLCVFYGFHHKRLKVLTQNVTWILFYIFFLIIKVAQFKLIILVFQPNIYSDIQTIKTQINEGQDRDFGGSTYGRPWRNDDVISHFGHSHRRFLVPNDFPQLPHQDGTLRFWQKCPDRSHVFPCKSKTSHVDLSQMKP